MPSYLVQVTIDRFIFAKDYQEADAAACEVVRSLGADPGDVTCVVVPVERRTAGAGIYIGGALDTSNS